MRCEREGAGEEERGRGGGKASGRGRNDWVGEGNVPTAFELSCPESSYTSIIRLCQPMSRRLIHNYDPSRFLMNFQGNCRDFRLYKKKPSCAWHAWLDMCNFGRGSRRLTIPKPLSGKHFRLPAGWWQPPVLPVFPSAIAPVRRHRLSAPVRPEIPMRAASRISRE